MMPEGDGLCPLEVGVARHDGGGVGLRLIAEHPDQLPKLVLQAGYRVFEGQAQIEGNLIYPRVVGSSVGLPAIWVLAAVTVGGSVMGIGGMLFAVPVASVLYALVRLDAKKKLEARGLKYEEL